MYPSPVRSDSPSAFLHRIDKEVVDATLDFIAPEDPEKRMTLETGISTEAIMIKGSVKDRAKTSLGPASVEWKLASVFMAINDDDIKPANNATRKWDRKMRKAAGRYYLGGYINYFDTTLPKKYYYGRNLKRLSNIKRKYDRKNVFKRQKGIWG